MEAAVERPKFFDFVAYGYDILTRQNLWKEQIARTLLYAKNVASPLRVLDLGCGPGVSAFSLAERLGRKSRIVGIDSSKKMIERARKNHERLYPHFDFVRFVEADAAQLPFEDGSFDLAVGHSFLYLTEDKEGILREVHRVLSRDGVLVLMEPYDGGSLLAGARLAAGSSAKHARHPYDASRFALSMVLWRVMSKRKGRFSPEEIDRLFMSAGFSDVSCHPTLAGLGMHCVGRVQGPVPQTRRGSD